MREDWDMAQRPSPRQVVIVLFPEVQSLDVTGPLEVFAGAGRLADRVDRTARGYEMRTLSADGAPLRTSSGLTLVPDGRLDQAPANIDTLIVPGRSRRAGRLRRRAAAGMDRDDGGAVEANGVGLHGRVRAGGRRPAGRPPRDHALGVGRGARAAVSGRAGRSRPDLRARRERVDLGGGDGGHGSSLALVEDDLDREAALTIARQLVLFLRRPGNQSQFSATLAAQQPEREPLREVQRQVVEEVAGDHSVEAMAARANMSARHFARVRGRDGRHAGALRRARAPGGGAPAGGRRGADRVDRQRVRLRHGGDDAARVPARARRGPGGVPPALSGNDKETRT